MFRNEIQNVMNEITKSSRRVVVCKLYSSSKILPCVFAEGYTVNHLVEEV